MKRKNVITLLIAVMMMLSSFAQIAFAETQLTDYTEEETRLGDVYITTAKTPSSATDTQVKWSQTVRKEGMWPGFYDTSVPPIIVNDKLYTALDNKVIVLSRETGEILLESCELAGSVGYSYMPICYGDGMIFVQIGDGKIQALSAETLESLWISEQTDVGGQTLAPITYKDGKIYTGSWSSEVGEGEYFCISVTDENVETEDEVKLRDWSLSHTGGFYWAGAYVTDNYAIFGGDDGAAATTQSDSAILYSVNPQTGEVLDKLENLHGDIRSSVVYDASSDRVYFTTKGGMLYQIKVNADGTFDDESLKGLDMGGASTATPIVYDGIVYTGIQSGANLPETIKVDGPVYVAVDAGNMQVLAAIPVPAYAQANGLLSSAYKEDGKAYIYTTYNNIPGGIYVIESVKNVDESGVVTITATGSDLYIPGEEMQNYCLSSLICDADGTIYYKVDSGYIVALRKEDSGKAITEFKIGGSSGIIDEQNKTISITLPAGTSLSSLIPQITVSKNATILPEGNLQTDFTSPVVYTVTAENGETQTYTVTANVQPSYSSGSVIVRPKDITVCVTVEKLTLGGGFIVEPVLVDTTTDKSAADVLCRVLEENNIDYNASNELGFYLSGIEDRETSIEIPDYIKEYLGEIKGRRDASMLCELDYSDSSGWMYMVNGKMPAKSASSYKLKDGDVVRWQFSLCGMGKDLTGGEDGLVETADKDDLIYEVAELSSYRDFDEILTIGKNREKYKNAMNVLSKIDSTNKEVDNAFYDLKNLDDEDSVQDIEENFSGNENEAKEEIPEKEVEQDKPEEEVPEENKPEEEVVKVEFGDTKGHWAMEYIHYLAGRNIISGKGNNSFEPDANITRAEFLAIIYRMNGEELAAESVFEDVEVSDWFAEAVTWALKCGVANGISEDSFAPNDKITREQMAVMLSQYIDYANMQLEESDGGDDFADSDEISQWAKDSVNRAKRLGIISGKGENNFAPRENATRAEAARMIYVLCTAVKG